MTPRHGVVVVDKPRGPASREAVDRVRAALGVRRAGHTGTLDPFATGVLPVCLGKATRLARFLAGGDKVYRATVRFGFATTTDDLLGEPLAPPRTVTLDEAALAAACRGLTGELVQVPPAYSAKRIGGRRFYDLARAGVPVPRAGVPVTVHALDVVEVGAETAEIEVRCVPGTYVRALARDLGESLGLGAHLVALRRTRSGSFGLDQATAWEDLTPEAVKLLPLSALLQEWPAVRPTAEGLDLVRHGRDVDRARVREGFPEGAPPPRLRVLDQEGQLVALAVPRSFTPAVPGLPVEPSLHPDVVLLD